MGSRFCGPEMSVSGTSAVSVLPALWMALEQYIPIPCPLPSLPWFFIQSLESTETTNAKLKGKSTMRMELEPMYLRLRQGSPEDNSSYIFWSLTMCTVSGILKT